MTHVPNPSTKLLLVDDDPGIVGLLTRIIKRSFKEKIEVNSLTSPEEAREQIKNKVVDILITDLEMPGINGLELLRYAKRRNACTQVLFMTGNSTLDALADALGMGATDYLLKPLDQTELIEIVGQAHERRRRWQQALAGTLAARRNRAPVSAR